MGFDDEGLGRKQDAVIAATQRIASVTDPLEVLRQVGGAELVAMAAAAVAARQRHLPVLLDGYVVTSAVLPDGGSLMLGGLSSVRNIERRAEVPWVAKIPLVGFFFKNEGYSDENKSLMILIRARITDVRDEMKKLETSR